MNEFAGSGAKRVRALFEAARKAAPCIVFIDELDSVGSRSKHGGWGMGHDTVNQLLAEMDGFKPTSNILVLAATNFQVGFCPVGHFVCCTVDHKFECRLRYMQLQSPT